MRFLQRSPRAPRPRGRLSTSPLIEDLEIRLALSASEIMAAGGGVAATVLMEPAFQLFRGGSPATSPETGSTGLGAQGFGSATPSGYTPQQIRTAYGIGALRFGSIVGDGTGQTIAIVDAYDDPALVDSSAPGFASSDLAQFDRAFGLPDPPSFMKLNEYGSTTNLPGTDPAGAGNSNWEVEEALDVEWAHAIAPGAKIDLIECYSSGGTNMYTGVTTAAGLAGVSVVSMSWGSSEYGGENFFDDDFTTPSGHQGVTFVAATGDNGSPGYYPAYSPNVVAAGGTTLNLAANGSYISETAWSGSGGGISSFENEPVYQQGVQSTGKRTVPDVSFDANPSTGVAVYNSYNGTSADPWEQIGGTSVAAPCWAGLIAIANQGRVDAGGTTLDGASQTLPALYSLSPGDYNDITSGSNGGFSAHAGYDETTGLGSPKANLLVPALTANSVSSKQGGSVAISTEPPALVTAGNNFGFTVKIENTNGSVETGYNGNVTVALANNPGGGALGGALTVTAQRGTATFSNLTLTRAASGYTLMVTAAGLSPVMTSAITVTPAAPSRLVVVTEPPANVNLGAPFGLTVAVEDNFGNVETAYRGIVTASLASGPSVGPLGGTLAVTVNGGEANFFNLRLNKAGTGYSIRIASVNSLAAAVTTPVNVIGLTPITPTRRLPVIRIVPRYVTRHAAIRAKGRV
jgi:subtilase family serine protease